MNENIPALVACSHGTHDPIGQRAVAGLVEAVRRRLDDVDVRDTFVDVQEPALETVLGDVTGEAVVVPLLLSAGYHVHHDIAHAVGGHPHRRAAAPLGPAPELAAMLTQRLREAGAGPEDAVVLGASASSHPNANTDVRRAVELLTAVWDGPVVGAGHVGHCGVPLADVVDAARRETGRRVVVASYLLAPGHFQRQVEASGAELTTAPLLGPEPDERLVRLVIARYREVVARLTTLAAAV